MKVLVACLLTAAISVAWPQSAAVGDARVSGDRGYSQVAGQMFCGSGTGSPTERHRSPDGSRTLVVTEVDTPEPRLGMEVNGVSARVRPPFWACTEFQWSPDSTAFFLTYSTGGLVGNYELRVYYPTPTELRVVDPARGAERDFLAHYPKCFDPERPNIAGVAWLSASRLLVAAQVLPHSNCDAMGTFATYEVDVSTGKVLHKYGQLESKSRFSGILGPELRNANDECVRNPSACWVPALHEKRQVPPNKALQPTAPSRTMRRRG